MICVLGLLHILLSVKSYLPIKKCKKGRGKERDLTVWKKGLNRIQENGRDLLDWSDFLKDRAKSVKTLPFTSLGNEGTGWVHQTLN